MTKRIFIYGALIASVLANGACSSDSGYAGGGALVTVSGVVNSIDDLQPAPGVRVYLLDNQSTYFSTVTTDATGAYSIQVPSGSTFVLTTDDFDSTVDNYIQLINFDVIHDATITEDMANVVIHACPNSVAPNKGSVAALNNYFANATTNAGIFAADTVANTRGMISLFVSIDSTSFAPLSSISVTTDNSACPTGYTADLGSVAPNGFYDDNITPDPTLGPNAFVASTTTETNSSGSAFVFCKDPETINVTITDNSGVHNFGGPYVVPVRKGGLTLVAGLTVNGKDRSTFTEFADALSILLGG